MNDKILVKIGALLKGHFELSSGLHSDKYIQCAKLMQTKEGMNWLYQAVSKLKVPKEFGNIDVIIGGAYGGIIFAYFLVMNFNNQARSMWCERVPKIKWSDKNGNWAWATGYENIVDIDKTKINSGKFQLRRGFEIKKGEKVLIAEDVTTTGKSIGEIAELIKDYGGEVVGAISIIDRREEKIEMLEYGEEFYNQGKITDGIRVNVITPFISLIQLDIKTWKSENCLMCKKSCSTCYDFEFCEEVSEKACCQWKSKIPLIKPGSKEVNRKGGRSV